MTEWIISSSVLIAVVAALRFILRGKIRLRIQYTLWALVLIRQIAKKPKTALYTLVTVILVAFLAACATFTGAKNAGTNNPGTAANPSSSTAAVSPSASGANANTIPLGNTDGALVVEDVPENASPVDGEVWLVHQEGYEIGLRNQGDRIEILLRRDGAVTVLGSAPSDSGSGMRYSLRSFDAIPQLNGFVLENLTSYGWGNFWYYMVRDDSAFCFAESFGEDVNDIAEDLDGDGQAELICNVTYNADGVRDVWVYRMKEGVPQVSSVKDAMLNIPGDKHLARPASAAYDVNTRVVTLEYLIAGEDELHIESAPIDYGSLQFKDFTSTETALGGTEYSGYDELIAQARDVLENFDGNYPEEEPFSSAFYQHWDYETLGYLIKDIDGNGVDELIFGANTDGWDNGAWDGVIYDIYTIVNREVFHVLDGWERNRYYLCENGCIANESSSSAFESRYSYYTYIGTELTPLESVLYYSLQDEEHPWFYTTEDEPDIKNAEQISQDQAAVIMNKYVHKHLQYTQFVE